MRETLSLQLDLHPKRTRIAIVMVTLALCAFFLAQGSTRLVAAKLFPIAQASTTGHTASTTGKSSQEGLKGERPPDMRAILQRNMFDPTTGPLWPPKPPVDLNTPVEDPNQVPELAPGQMPPSCEGQARLVSTMYSETLPSWSFATISVGSTATLLYRPGAQVDAKTIDSIYPEAVFLKAGNGALCSLTMFRPPESVGKGATNPQPAMAQDTAAEGSVQPAQPSFYGSSLSEAELDQNIKQLSETKYTVTRGLIDKVLANQPELMRSARVVPHEENGKVIGVKMYGIRRSSLLGKLGLQNGDLLRTINGFDMASPDSALEAYTKLRSAGNLSVAVVRRGSPVTMDYTVGN